MSCAFWQGIERLYYVESYADYPDKKHVMRLFRYKQPDYYGIKIYEKQDFLTAKKNGRL